MARKENEMFPDFTAEIEAIEENGISSELLYKILQKHRLNSKYNRKLYDRYEAIEGGVPIFGRQPRYDEENPINNKANNDFFGEIVDFKVGYFAGSPATYSYSIGDEAEEVIGG